MKAGVTERALGLMFTVVWLELCVPGQIAVLSETSRPRVFAGPTQPLSLLVCNTGSAPVQIDLRARLVQVAATITVEFSEQPAKQFPVLPRQTVREAITLNLPNVRAATRFVVQWVAGGSNVVGVTELMVYPTNLLAELKTLTGKTILGVFDPADELKPLLRGLKIESEDLEQLGTDKFAGRLAIFGPFTARPQMRANLRNDIQAMAKRGVAVVWLLPPVEDAGRLKPSFYPVRIGEGMVIVAAAELVAQLRDRPEAQLNLLRLAREAIQPGLLDLPETDTPI